MRIILKLALANARLLKARLIFASLSMIAASCIIVWMVSGYDALVGQFKAMAEKSMGHYDLVVAPEKSASPGAAPKTVAIPQALLDEFRADGAVAEAACMAQARGIMIKNPKAKPMPGSGAQGGLSMGSERGTIGGDSPASRNNGRGGALRPGGAARASDEAQVPASAEGSLASLEKKRSSSGGEKAGGPQKQDDSSLYFGRGANAGRPVLGMPQRGPALTGTDALQAPYKMLKGAWIGQKEPEKLEAVLSESSARQLQAEPGTELVLTSSLGEFRVKLVGVMESGASPMGMGGSGGGVYVSLANLQRISGAPPKISSLSLKLKDGVHIDSFNRKWSEKLKKDGSGIDISDLNELAEGMSSNFSAENSRKQAWSTTGLSLLAAFFIIFSTLSMGVSERGRQFAVMRAIGLTKGQIAMLVALESLFLALVGWLGGLAMGWGLLQATMLAKPEVFPNGASIGIWCVFLTGLCSFCGALGAALLPAWRATRVSPLEAMAPLQNAKPAGLSLWATVAGLLLICVNPLIVYGIGMEDKLRCTLYGLLGCTTMALGFILLTPLAIIAVEKLLGPPLSFLFRLDRRLLAAQLSNNIWRTLGTTVSLTVGLGLYVSIQTWGYSMLVPFFPGGWLPDMVVALLPAGVPDAEIENVKQVKGVNPKQCLPMAIEQPKLASDMTGSKERNSVVKQDNVLFLGLDPDLAFGGQNPLATPLFVQGNRDEALTRLKEGRYCIVPDHFCREAKLKLGDSFKVLPPSDPSNPVEYKIAGVVTLPGWHWITKLSGMRRTAGRTGAMIFASYENVRRDFKLTRVNYFWLNTDGSSSTREMEESMQLIVEKHEGEKYLDPLLGELTSRKPYAKITATNDVKTAITRRADGMIWGMSQLPLVILMISAFGVVNTILASVRARRWEMGVMRAIGVTRFALVRIVFAEAVLIALVACVLSLAFGVMAGWCGAGMSRYMSFFGGMDTPLVLPWAKMSLGFGITLALCLAAAVWPALATGRKEPLKLLQAGRGSQ